MCPFCLIDDELEHTDVEGQSPQEQPRPHGHFDRCLQCQELISIFTRKREVCERVTEENLVQTYCILESSEIS